MLDEDKLIFFVLGSNMLEDDLKSFVLDLKNRVGESAQVKYANIEEEEGSRIGELYEIAPDNIPAVLLIKADETFCRGWYGQDLPQIDILVNELS